MTRILITPRSLSSGTYPRLQALEKQGFTLVRPTPGATPQEADLMASIPGCVGWIAGVEPISPAVIHTADKLVVISRNGSGVDNLPMDAITARGIVVKRAMGTNARGVAELALSLMLSAMRNVVQADAGIRAGTWPRAIGSEISASTIGIVGLGVIGCELAEMCLSLNARVIGFDPFAPDDVLTSHQTFERADTLSHLATSADVISLHAPMQPSGVPLLDAEIISQLKPGAIVVNTARSGLVDSDALLAALESGSLRTYATDVFEQEPPQRSALLDHPGTIQTSHIGGFTRESVERTTAVTVQNLLDALDPVDA